MKPIIGFARSLPLLAFLIVIGCASPKTTPTHYSPPDLATAANTREVNGFAVSVEPIFDKARSQEFFHADAIANGILPIGISVKNNSTNASFILRKQDMDFVSSYTNTVAGRPDGTDIRKDKSHDATSTYVIYSITAGLPMGFLMGAGEQAHHAQDLQFRFVQGELRDQTLSPGQSAHGFLYIKVPPSIKSPSGILTIKATDLRSQNTTQIEIPVNYENR